MDLEQRVEKLERENRRLKVSGGAVVAVLLTVALVGALGAPASALVQDRIVAREIEIQDDAGLTRVHISAEHLRFTDETGGARLVLDRDFRGNYAVTLYQPEMIGRSLGLGFDSADQPLIELCPEGCFPGVSQDLRIGFRTNGDPGITAKTPFGIKSSEGTVALMLFPDSVAVAGDGAAVDIAPDRVRLLDGGAVTRVLLTADTISYIDSNGKMRVSINEAGVGSIDENGKLRAMLNNEGIASFDVNQAMRATLTNDGVAILDENEATRVSLGSVALTTPSTGAETSYPAAVVLYDAEGNVIWQAPQ